MRGAVDAIFAGRQKSDLLLAFSEDDVAWRCAALSIPEVWQNVSSLRALGARLVWFLRGVGKVLTMRLPARDWKIAYRSLRKSPGFAAVAVLTLALGLGANIAIFTLMYAVMLRDLPVPHPEQIVQLEMWQRGQTSQQPYHLTSMYNVVAAHQTPLAGMCGWLGDELTMSGGQRSRLIEAADITGDCLSTLQVRPLAGRLLEPADDVEGGGPQGFAAVLSYSFWQTEFQGDPKIIGRRIALANMASAKRTAVVVGVLPRSFRGLVSGFAPSLYLPSYFEGRGTRDSNGNISMLVFGRLKPHVGRQQAESQLAPAFAAWRKSMPAGTRGDLASDLRDHHLAVVEASAGWSALARDYGKALHLLQVLVGLILVAGCGYLAILMQVRAAARKRELALRFALGATRARIATQLFAESALLVMAGAAGAALVAWFVSRLLVSFVVPANNLDGLDLTPDATLLAFAFAITCLTAVLIGIGPALSGSQTNLVEDLKEVRGAVFGRRSRVRLHIFFLPLQIAFSVVIVVLAGLFSASLMRAIHQDNGFRLSGTVFLSTTMPTIAVEKHEGQARMAAAIEKYNVLRRELAHQPGISAASMTKLYPLGGAAYIGAYRTLGGEQSIYDRQVHEDQVSPGYFGTVGIPLLGGRDFSDNDNAQTGRVCILSASAARYLFPRGDAVGRQVMPLAVDAPITIVGIVSDTRWDSLQAKPVRMIYLPISQETEFLLSMQIALRADNTEMAIASARNVLRRNGVEILDAQTMEEKVKQSLGQPRLLASLTVMLALLALTLSALAVYGIFSYAMSQRTAEIAVRLAVGATRADVLGLAIRRAAAVVIAGLVMGLLAGLGMERVVASLLYETQAATPWISVASLSILAAVGLGAAFVPAFRASRTDPMQILRAE
jgi:predicted permease